MESWEIELLKIGATAIVGFFLGWGSQWFRSRTRKKERATDFEEYLKKREVEKAPEQEKLQEAEKLTSLLIEHKTHSITLEELNEFREKIFSQTFEDKLEALSLEGTSDAKEEFLRRAYGYRSRAYILLLMTMTFQVAMREHRAFEPAEIAKGNTMDEKIPNMIKRILDNGLDTVFPIRLIDEKNGETRSVITPEIVEGLKQINSLIDLRQKIENDEIELPSSLDIDSLFDKIGNALSTIALSLEVVGTNSILYQYKMTSAIEALKKEIEQSDIEQRPIRFPPPNSD